MVVSDIDAHAAERVASEIRDKGGEDEGQAGCRRRVRLDGGHRGHSEPVPAYRRARQQRRCLLWSETRLARCGGSMEHVKLPAFGVAEPSMRSHVGSLSGYESRYMPLAPQVRERIAKEWRRCFEEWDYPV